MAPRTHAVRCGLLCLVPADTCRLLVFTVTVLCPAAMGLLLPFGTSQGDARSQSDSNSGPAVSLSIPFVFFGNQYNTLSAINDGFVSFTADNVDIYDVQSDFTEVGIAAVCVFCSDIVPGTSGSVWNRLTTDTVALQTIQNVTREYQQFGSAFTPSWAFVVTWDKVLTYQYTGPSNTMQAILASNGNTSVVILQYDIISWVDDDGEIGNNEINTKVGFNKGDGIQFYLFPESKTAALSNLTVTSNTGSPGLFLFRVDVTTISPTLTKTTTTVPTTAPTTTTAAAATTTSVTTTAAETTTTVPTTTVPNSAVPTTAYVKVAPFLSCVTIILLCYTGTIPVSKGIPSA